MLNFMKQFPLYYKVNSGKLSIRRILRHNRNNLNKLLGGENKKTLDKHKRMFYNSNTQMNDKECKKIT